MDDLVSGDFQAALVSVRQVSEGRSAAEAWRALEEMGVSGGG